MDSVTLKLAAKIDRKLATDYQQYLSDCQVAYRAGFRPRSCEHGTNMWTEYDPICGACENGVSMGDGVTRMSHALREAKARMNKVTQIASAIGTFAKHGCSDVLDQDALNERLKRIMTA